MPPGYISIDGNRSWIFIFFSFLSQVILRQRHLFVVCFSPLWQMGYLFFFFRLVHKHYLVKKCRCLEKGNFVFATVNSFRVTFIVSAQDKSHDEKCLHSLSIIPDFWKDRWLILAPGRCILTSTELKWDGFHKIWLYFKRCWISLLTLLFFSPYAHSWQLEQNRVLLEGHFQMLQQLQEIPGGIGF